MRLVVLPERVPFMLVKMAVAFVFGDDETGGRRGEGAGFGGGREG